MPQLDLDYLLSRYEEYLDKGIAFYRTKDLKKSREYLLLAAERLFEIAEHSEGDLYDLRLNAANELVDQVEEIDAEIEAGKQSLPGGGRASAGTGDNTRELETVNQTVRPEITLSDVAGLEGVKQLIRDKLIDPFLYPELKAEFGITTGGGILLYGPPGTGKTMLARAVAGEVDAAFYAVTPTDIMSKWVGDPEKNIRDLFDVARKYERAVIFFDEIDGLASSRQRSEDYMRRLVNQLLAEIQGFDRHESSLLFIGATNHPSLIDHALLRPGRFDELIAVPLPDLAARRRLWELKLAKIERLGRIDYEELAQVTEGYSGSEIEYVCQKAGVMAGQRWKAGESDSRVEMADLRQALDRIQPRTSAADMEALLAFGRQFDKNLVHAYTGKETVAEFTPAPSADYEGLPAAVIEDVRDLIVQSPLDFRNLAGMEGLRQEMEFAVEVPLNPEKRALYQEITGDPPRNPAMLLYGAPGCGKTFMALAAAGEFSRRYGFTVIHVPTRAVAGLHYSKHLQRIVEIFNLAKERSPSIVIWDEFDGIAESSDFSGRKHQVAVCSELKGQFEGVVRSKALVAHIATSNYPWNLETALMRDGRLGRLIHVKPPDAAARHAIISMVLEKSNAVEGIDYARLAAVAEGMTTTEIRSWLKECLNDRFEQAVVNGTGRTESSALDTEMLVVALDMDSKKEYISWLRSAHYKLNLKKYACQRDFFAGLMQEISLEFEGNKSP